MNKHELIQRTQAYALRVVKAVQALPRDEISSILGKQLLRSGTSVGANYRAACRAKSTADFVNKLKIVEEECDESIYWMELLVAAGSLSRARLAALLEESDELLSIFVSAIKTTRSSRAA
ncbi:four helix bundle protein [Oleiharenicola lentus]|uniref:Four helix bundle protein n=1 Tax=Oleiharenicola lentus TaxID=2508720 RepID=A0A4Q1C7D4_9BACT|nr:four helix bundle protein [Oleiharenicola lentus]RXK54662.1 four helix bundle protein [Oleiharenicola lentus]